MEHVGDTLNVTVEYQLDEYKQMVRDFIPVHMAAKDRLPNPYLPWNWPIVVKLMLAVFVPLIFKFKKSKVGSCRFTFSQAGLTRESKDGADTLSWDEVSKVHHLSAAYLIELEVGGAMPVPYRVFSIDQRTIFESFLGGVGA